MGSIPPLAGAILLVFGVVQRVSAVCPHPQGGGSYFRCAAHSIRRGAIVSLGFTNRLTMFLQNPHLKW